MSVGFLIGISYVLFSIWSFDRIFLWRFLSWSKAYYQTGYQARRIIWVKLLDPTQPWGTYENRRNNFCATKIERDRWNHFIGTAFARYNYNKGYRAAFEWKGCSSFFFVYYFWSTIRKAIDVSASSSNIQRFCCYKIVLINWKILTS